MVKSGAILVAAMCAALAGCATLDPFGDRDAGRSVQTPPVSQPEAEPAVAPSPEHARLVAMFGGEYRAPAAEAHLNQVLARLAKAEETPGRAYRVTILNTPTVNAFALPSGNLYVTRGLLALANDTAEVAAVMAHEIAHVTARHASQREEAARTADLRQRVASVVQSRERGEEVQAIEKLSLASFSRRQELEADQIGVRTIARAGYDPYGAARFLEALGKSTAMRASLLGQRGSDEADIMSTHPSTPERINRAIAAAREVGAPGSGDNGRDAYLNAIAGIDFGDDPAEGLVRGRTFLQGRLGFMFTAPEGFTLESASQAVLGVANKGNEALRLDSVRVPGETSLDTYMATGWIEGLDRDSVQETTVNGLPAAKATATSAEWRFRIAAVRLGGEVYRVIFASRSLTPELDRRFMASINSFRRISPQEMSSVRALRLAIVTARAGDTSQSLGARMAIPEQGHEVFLLINGIRRAGPLQPGARYKLVQE
jgi:predicted Zn-dependent protease